MVAGVSYIPTIDPRYLQAERVVASTYGDTVSVLAKRKNLNKFGRKTAVGSSWTTLMPQLGTEINETFVSTNAITTARSTSSADNGLVTVLEGQTIDGSGNMTFVAEDVTLDATDGQTPVAITTALARVTRSYVKNSGTFNSPQSAPAGNVYYYDGSAPGSDSSYKLILEAGETQSEKAAISISQSDYWFLDQFSASIDDPTGPTSYVELRMVIRDVANGGVWRPLGRKYNIFKNQNGIQRFLSPCLIVPKNHDWRIQARTDGGSATVYAEAGGVLASVV